MKFSRTVWCMAVALSVVVSSSVWAGKFVPVYSNVSNPVFREWQKELKADRVLESLAEYLNGTLIVPMDVTITVTECGTSNAFYSPKDQAIIICYELIGDFYRGALELGWSEGNAKKATENATAFFFYHELGHALIHVLDLPTTAGRRMPWTSFRPTFWRTNPRMETSRLSTPLSRSWRGPRRRRRQGRRLLSGMSTPRTNSGSSTSSVGSTDRIPDGSRISFGRGIFPRLEPIAARASGRRSTRAGLCYSSPTSRQSDREIT